MQYIDVHKKASGDECADAIESLQVAMVRAGSTFLSRESLGRMTVEDLSQIMSRNYMGFTYMKEPYDEVSKRKAT